MQEMQETQVQSLGWEDHLEEEMTIHPSILAWGKRGAWWAIVHGVAKSWTRNHFVPSCNFSKARVFFHF